jgi:uncharacterized membrane protein YesL
MIAGLGAVWHGLRHLSNRGYLYVWANLFWAALTLLVITAPAAWAGLARLNFVLLRQPSATMDDFWQGVRENLRRSLALGLLNAFFILITVTNLLAYANQSGLGVIVLRLVWAISLAGWILVQYFGWAFFYAMHKPSYVGALRNACIMILRYPSFVLAIGLAVVVIGVVSSLLPGAWILITGSTMASIAGAAVQNRLRAAGIDRSTPFDEGLVVEPSFDDL